MCVVLQLAGHAPALGPLYDNKQALFFGPPKCPSGVVTWTTICHSCILAVFMALLRDCRCVHMLLLATGLLL